MKFQLANILSITLGLSLTLAIPARAQKAHPALPTLGIPEALGVNIHFTDARPGELKMLSEGGFRIARMDFAWAGTEKEKGVYDFADYDRLLEQLEAAKVQPLFILDYSNAFYDDGQSPTSEAAQAAFAKWAAASAVHFKGQKILWEMYNEPNGFWKPTRDDAAYIRLALATGKALKAATPNECYIGPALAGFDFNFFEACFKAGLLNYWDAVSVHPYRGNNPESASLEYRRLRLMIERYKPKSKVIPVLSGEWGYSTKGISETQQAQYLPRQWMTNLMNGVPVSIWYDWHNDGTDPGENEHNFGTTRFEYHEGRDPVYDPKPSYVAAKTFSQFFSGYRFNKRLALANSNDYLLIFNKGQEVRFAVWTTGPQHFVSLPVPGGDYGGVDYLNQAQGPMPASAAGLEVAISESPIYFEPQVKSDFFADIAAWPTQPLEQIVTAPVVVTPVKNDPSVTLRRDALPVVVRINSAFQSKTLTQTSLVVVSNPLKFGFEPALGGGLNAWLENENGVAFKGSISLNGQAANAVSFKAGEIQKIFELLMPRTAADGSVPIKLHFQGSQKEDVIDLNAKLVPIKAFGNLTFENLDTALVANPDGDAKIASEQTLTVQKKGPEPAPNDGPVLSLKYQMSPGWKFINIQPRDKTFATVEAQPRSLGMWIYGDGSGNLVRMRYSDSGGQTFQPNGEALSWKGWKYVGFPMDGSGGHWGGANDGVIHGAIKIETLVLLDSAGQKGSAGEVFFSGPSWVYVSAGA